MCGMAFEFFYPNAFLLPRDERSLERVFRYVIIPRIKPLIHGTFLIIYLKSDFYLQ